MADAPEQTSEQQPWTPTKQLAQNGVRTTGRAFNSANWRVKSEESPSSGSPRFNNHSGNNSPRSPFNNNKSGQPVPQSITEGRRLYVGNMPYTAKREDVETIFEGGDYSIERVDISIDPFTGRNPSYCFVELATKEQADRAMVELDGKDFQGRPVRIKPGVAKSAQDRSTTTRSPQGSPSRFNDATGSPSTLVDRWQRKDASSSPSTKGDDIENSRRLYVGGLPKIMDKQTLDADVQAFFNGYNVEAISKLISPHPSKRFEPGDHYYLFVDFASIEEAAAAQTALDGQDGPWGSKVRLGRARGESTKAISDRQKLASSQNEPAFDTVAV